MPCMVLCKNLQVEKQNKKITYVFVITKLNNFLKGFLETLRKKIYARSVLQSKKN